MTLAEKLELFRGRFDEVAFGWNDSGCFWHFQYGPRGSGSMMRDFGDTFSATEAETFEEAVDTLLAHLGLAVELTTGG